MSCPRQKKEDKKEENITSDEDNQWTLITNFVVTKGYKLAIFFNNVYVKSVILEGEMSSSEMQAPVSNNYGKLQLAFNSFRNILKNNLLTTKSVC